MPPPCRRGESSLDFISSIWEARYHFPKAEALSYMHNELIKGQALILLDALDETIIGKTQEESESSYRRVMNAIINLATLYYKAPLVVTARKAGYFQRARLGGFTELEVLDFRPEDIESFVNKWFDFHPVLEKRSNAADLILRLKRNPRLHTLTANPLLLTLTTIVYEAQLDLPDRRSELYKQCLDILLTKWDASRNNMGCHTDCCVGTRRREKSRALRA
jgi:predicted NACHT family NTPase